MRKLFLSLFLCSLFLSACSGGGSGNTGTDDLTGTWKQTNSNSKTSYQEAVISDGVIDVFWVNEENSSRSLYWAGTYAAPDSTVTKYSWDSQNDTEKTSGAMLASSADTKTFTYDGGVLSYEASALGTTQTIKLEKAE